MTLTPTSWNDLATALQSAGRNQTRVEQIDLARLSSIRRYAPEDLTVTVEAGISLGTLQAALRRHGQWLPIDPPGAEALSIAEILDRNLSGPRRQGYGTIREYLLGVRVVLADGRIVRSGGEVVKNVAGYDLLKLFVGAGRSLGVIVEAAFKLLPVPAREVFVEFPCASWDDASRHLDRVLSAPVTPVVCDLHQIVPAPNPGRVATLVLGFAGCPEEVDWQLGEVRALGLAEPSSLDYATTFTTRPGAGPLEQKSVLPSRLIETLQSLVHGGFVARAGNGLIEYRSAEPGTPGARSTGAVPTPHLVRRVKAAFDPAGVLPAPPGLA